MLDDVNFQTCHLISFPTKFLNNSNSFSLNCLKNLIVKVEIFQIQISGVGATVGSCSNLPRRNSNYNNRTFSENFHDFFFHKIFY